MGTHDNLESVFCTARFLSYLRRRCTALELPLHFFLQRPDDETFAVIREVLSKTKPNSVQTLRQHFEGKTAMEIVRGQWRQRGWRDTERRVREVLDRLAKKLTQPAVRETPQRPRKLPARSPDRPTPRRTERERKPKWEPSLEEIRAECEKIRATWSPHEERTRRGLTYHEEDEEGLSVTTCRSAVAEPYCGPGE